MGPCMSFDLNQELAVIECHLAKKVVLGQEIEYCYHVHRLGSRVPLFLFGGPVTDESWNYFGKLGNLLTFTGGHDFQRIFCELLRRYGSIYTIVLAYDSSFYLQLTESFRCSPFLQSEIRSVVRFCTGEPLGGILNFLVCDRNADNGNSVFVEINTDDSVEVINAKLMRVLQAQLKDDCLDWKWQYEQSDKLFLRGNLVLKNLEKWTATDCCGERVKGTNFIPMKLMHDSDPNHSPSIVHSKIPNIGAVVDLSNDEGSYDKKFLTEKNIDFYRIQLASKIVPSSKDITQFILYCKNFSHKNPNKTIVVHCHYGYNRTGLMICAYLIEELGCTVKDALERFRLARPPGIKHQNYIDKLHLRYGN